MFTALAGPPSVAHAEALLRGTALKGAALGAPLDAIVVPIPWETMHQPRAPLDPISVAHIGLGLALRLWRERSPLLPGGTVVLLHSLRAAFGRASAAPYRALYEALRETGPEHLAAAESRLAHDRAAIDAYRSGRAPHPLLPFADWAACEPVLAHAGRVIVGGCRDAVAARRLGFVPSHSPQAALEMAAGVAGEGGRIGRAPRAAVPTRSSSAEPAAGPRPVPSQRGACATRDIQAIHALRPRSGRLQGVGGRKSARRISASQLAQSRPR